MGQRFEQEYLEAATLKATNAGHGLEDGFWSLLCCRHHSAERGATANSHQALAAAARAADKSFSKTS